MLDFLLYASYVGALYGLIKVVYDMFTKKKWRDVRKSHEFIILTTSILVVTCFYIPWSSFNYGQQKTKIVYIDSSKLKQAKRPNVKPLSVQRETVYIKPASIRHFKPIPIVTRDTFTKIPANGIVSTGANAHNVAGTGNHVGINGDVYINADKTLTEAGLKDVYYKVEDIRKKFNTQKALSIGSYNYCNAELIQQQLADYFSSKGYAVSTGGQIMSGGNSPMVFGFEYNHTTDLSMITVDLGYFK